VLTDAVICRGRENIWATEGAPVNRPLPSVSILLSLLSRQWRRGRLKMYSIQSATRLQPLLQVTHSQISSATAHISSFLLHCFVVLHPNRIQASARVVDISCASRIEYKVPANAGNEIYLYSVLGFQICEKPVEAVVQ
jgi:hypothetical protein